MALINKEKLKEKSNEKFWCIVAFIIAFIYIYSLIKVIDSKPQYYGDPNSPQPSEYEIRGCDGGSWCK